MKAKRRKPALNLWQEGKPLTYNQKYKEEPERKEKKE